MSKFRTGQVLNVYGRQVVIVRIERSCHGNTSRITLADVETGKEWPRTVRTAWLTEASRKTQAAIQ